MNLRLSKLFFLNLNEFVSLCFYVFFFYESICHIVAIFDRMVMKKEPRKKHLFLVKTPSYVSVKITKALFFQIISINLPKLVSGKTKNENTQVKLRDAACFSNKMCPLFISVTLVVHFIYKFCFKKA